MSALRSINKAQQLLDLDRADCEDSLYAFLRHAWKYIDPAHWQDGWPIEAVAEHLQAVIDGEISRLIINIPPRMGKSSICSVALPAWTWAQRQASTTSGPGVQFLHASYAESLSMRDSVKCRRLIKSDWYQRFWGHRFKLNADQDTKHRFGNNQGGERLITSITGHATGEGGNCFVAGTMVATPSGEQAIETLSAGDEVLAFDHQRGMVVKSKVVATAQRTSNDIHHLRSASGHSVTCTGDHPIFSPGRGYIRAHRMGRGDGLIVAGEWHGSAGHATASPMRQLRRGDRQDAVRDAQGAQTGKPGRLLLGRVFSRSSCREEQQAMPSMRRAQGSSPEILLQRMRDGLASIAAARKQLPAVRHRLHRTLNVLFPALRRSGALRSNDGREQFQLFGARALLQSVCGDARIGDGPRRPLLRELWSGGRGQDIFGWSRGHKSTRTSSQRGYARECAGELDHALSELPQPPSSWDIASVASVRRISMGSVNVHDIQVAGCSNFFANGVLVHNCIIIDDPNAANEAFSEATIQSTIEWWDQTMSSRLNDPKTGAFIIIQQRLAVDDLSGHILEGDDGEFCHLALPMHYDPDRSFMTPIGWKDPRTETGELLWPERFGEAEVTRLEKVMGPFIAAGQLEQLPSPKGGAVIKREWWLNWKDDTSPPMDYIVASLDTAYTEKTENDYSALTIWGVFTTDPVATASRSIDADGRPIYFERTFAEQAPKVMLLAAWQERLALHDLVTKVGQTCKEKKVDRLIIENKAAGISVAQELRRLFGNEGFAVQLQDPKSQDKLSRLYSVQHLFAEGLIYAPDRKWADLVITQVEQFPKGKHDDFVDTVSQALKHLRDVGVLVRSSERMAEIEDMKTLQRAPEPLYPGSA